VRLRFGDDTDTSVQFLGLPAGRGTRGQQAAAILGQQPAVQRPAIQEGGQQPARIDDRQFLQIRMADRGPVAMGEVDMGDREGARNEGLVAGIELALDPVGPYPIQVVLDDAAVD
jgi:hypothetical protein